MPHTHEEFIKKLAYYLYEQRLLRKELGSSFDAELLANVPPDEISTRNWNHAEDIAELPESQRKDEIWKLFVNIRRLKRGIPLQQDIDASTRYDDPEEEAEAVAVTVRAENSFPPKM